MPRTFGMLKCATWLLVALVAFGANPAAATDYDLNGLYQGRYVDQGRMLTRNHFRLRISQQGDRITGVATDNTVRIRGRVVGDSIQVEWDHSSGNYGEGQFEILEQGERIRGTWKSKGSGRFYGTWDLRRQPP